MSILNLYSPSSGGTVQWEDINGRPDLSNVATLKVVTITFPVALWGEDRMVTVTVPDIDEDPKTQVITPTPSPDSYNTYYENDILLVDQTVGGLMFKAASIPTEDVTVYIYIQSVAELGEAYAGEFEWWSPKMTADDAPAPYVASANAVYQSKYPAYKAFNDIRTSETVDSECWYNGTRNEFGFIQFDFGANTIVKGIRLLPSNYDSRWYTYFPIGIGILGSDDGTAWESIINDDGVGYDPSTIEWRTVEFKPCNYRFYKITNTSVNLYGDWQMIIDEIQFLKLEVSA